MISPPVLLDFETRSRADLKKIGGRRYSIDPSTEVLCCAWYDTADGSRGVWLEGDWPHHGRVLGAHNAMGFDRFIADALGWACPAEQWIDTSELARRAGLPGALDALGTRWLGIAKDKDASRFTTGLSSVRRPAGKGPGAIPPDVWRDLSADDKRAMGVLPEITPEVMARVVPYCVSDVDILEHGWPLLESWADLEPDVQRVDRVVNDRGIYFDAELAVALLECDQRNVEQVCAAVGRELGWSIARVMAAANSPAQFCEVTGAPNAQKEVVDAMDHPLAKARQALASIAAGKLEAGLARCSDDFRLRDMLRYYAAHTGRWGGKGMQPQNLPRPHKRYEEWTAEQIDDLSVEVSAGRHFASQDEIDLLVRATLTAKDGHGLAVCDFSGVEARALAWCANDHGALRVFREGKADPYKVAASVIFGVPYGEIDKAQRQVGKIAELACITGDTLVLTDNGLMPLVRVTKAHKLWDGVEWVSHEGLVTRGIKPTVELRGLRGTRDHLVWCGGSIWCPLGQLARDVSTHSLASEIASASLPSRAIELQHRAAFTEYLFDALAADLSTIRTYTICVAGDPLVATAAQRNSQGTGSSISGVTPRSYLTMSTEDGLVTDSQRSATGVKIPGLRTTQTTGDAEYVFGQHGCQTTDNSTATSLVCRAGITPPTILTESITTKVTSPVTYASCLATSIKATDEACRPCSVESTSWKAVYDIAHAGPRNRYTVMTSAGPLIVHNCGYGMGAGKFEMTALKMGGVVLADIGVDADDVVASWRQLHAPIVRFWRACEDAFVRALQGHSTRVDCFEFTCSDDGRDVAVFLPSGRPIVYNNAQISWQTDKWGREKPSPSFHGTKGREHTYGGKITENLIQALCRDLMADALVRAEDAGLRPVLHVHDEIVCEVPDDALEDGYQELHHIMTTVPEWAAGFPIGAAGFKGKRYRK